MNSLRILVVDDSPTMRRIISAQLKQVGYHDVGEAENGQHALQELEARKFNFVLTDWNMPLMNGLEFIKEVRAREEYKKLPIIVVTTRNAKQDVIMALKAGANNFVTKPFSPNALDEKIKKVVQIAG
jgi:two-component system, chemotaxis family, chemotaxis protein CheY